MLTQREQGNHREEFRQAIADAGITPPQCVDETNGKPARFPTNGKRGDDSGWYTFHADGVPAGAYGCWRTGVSGSWSAKPERQFTPTERAAFAKRIEQAKATADAERKRDEAKRRTTASEIWAQCKVSPGDHGYLTRKGVTIPGLRVYTGELIIRDMPCDGCLVMPLRDKYGTLQSLEFISERPDDNKRYLWGPATPGCYFGIKGEKDGPFCIVEGLSTGGSIHMATGYSVAIASNRGNLSHVARALREKYPEAELILAADNDKYTICKRHADEGAMGAADPLQPRPEWCRCNPGLSDAAAAANAVNGRLTFPRFSDAESEGSRPTDFNDFAALRGLDELRGQVEADKEASQAADPVTTASPRYSGITYRRMADIEPKPIDWLWPGRFARGKVSLIAGHPGLGKSQCTASLTAIVTTGGCFPADRVRAQRGNVVILSAEDDPEDTIRPRLEAAGADLTRVYMLDAVRDEDREGNPISRSFNLKTDLLRLGALLEEIGDVALVIIDPISAYLGGVDTHYNAEVRSLLAPLGDMAARHGAAVVCVSHLNKGSGGGTDALMRVTGSIAFVAAARAAYIVVKDDENEARRLFLPLKNNNGNDRTGLAFSVEGQTLGNGIETSLVMWEGDAVTVTADEAMAVQTGDRSEREEAIEFLRKTLEAGRVPSREIDKDAEANGISRATLRRAKAALGVKAVKEGQPGKPDAPGQWYWRLPYADELPKMLTNVEGAQVKKVSTFGESEHLRAEVTRLFHEYADRSGFPPDGRDEDLAPMLQNPELWLDRLRSGAMSEQPL